MVNLNDPNLDGQSKTEEYWVMATYFTDEGEIWDEQIGEVTLPKDISDSGMPCELEINGVHYERRN